MARPSAVAAATMASAMRTRSRPYSVDTTPRSSARRDVTPSQAVRAFTYRFSIMSLSPPSTNARASDVAGGPAGDRLAADAAQLAVGLVEHAGDREAERGRCR